MQQTSAPPPDAGAADPAGVVAELKARRARLVEDGPPPGRAWCHAATEAVDDALGTLAAPLLARHRFAVVAVGGYGRRELCPSSDIDLLLLHDRLDDAVLEELVRAVVYPLWDVGLTVGYAVRDRRESLGAIDDLDSATATLDLRTVTGDTAFVQLVRTEVVRRLRRRPHHFLAALREADRGRRARAGDAAEVLEPHLKDGAGGLRDVQSLRWAAAALVGAVGLDPLVPAGYLGAPDRPRIAAAEERLLAARVATHLVAAGTTAKPDVLRLELHDEVAARLGHVDADAHDLAPHRLLRELYLAARTIDHVHRRAWALIDADVARGRRRLGRPTEREVDGFELVDGVLRLPADTERAGAVGIDDPSLPSRLLVALADTGAVLDRGSAARLRNRAERGVAATATDTDAGPPDPAPPWGWSDACRDRVVGVLLRGEVALPALAELDEVGVWSAWVPEWAPTRGRAQRNPYHRYALDRHGFHAAAELGELVRREPWAAETLAEVDDREALVLGTLVHDVGKAFGEPHEETGIPVAAAIAQRMGARDGTIARIEQLVRLHLLLPDTARRRDVGDPALAYEIAEIVGDRSTLAMLQLLAVADGRATGPTAWSEWTAALVRRLVTKVTAVFDETDPDEVAGGAAVTARAAQELAPELGADPERVRAHLARLPRRYAAAVSPRAVVRHTLMVANPPGLTEVRTRVTPGEDDPEGHGGIDELDVVAVDHPGWFAKVAGVVALHGGSIVAADAFTREDGLAVDTFKVMPPEGTSGSWWVRVEGDLDEAAGGRLAVRARVLDKARSERPRVSRLPAVATKVTVDEDPSGRATIVEVRALDRIGVLYAIATALAELELDIVVARVQTMGHEVTDVFYVRDRDGGTLGTDHLAELELAVTGAIIEL
ncbi:MAG: [protein-PII] uridylyltransferase [Nitriliruptoraceae bacterium]